MDLRTFIQDIRSTGSLPNESVIFFVAKEYSFLFFSYFFGFLQKYAITIQRMNVTFLESADIKARLSMASFSGKELFFLEGVNALSAKKQQEWIEYCRSYSGPHVILICIPQDSASQVSQFSQIIVVSDVITQNDFATVRFLVNGETGQSIFVSRFEKSAVQVSLDTACLLAEYERVVGKNAELFFQQWLTRLLEPSTSLFLLSQYFFAKKSELFFKQWSYNEENYPTTYWVMFWADQIWRAYIYVSLMKQKRYDEAKKAQYKLPFSFINRDWSLCSLIELRNAHDFLYSLDFNVKNGGTQVALELFYCMFFEGRFGDRLKK